MGSDLLIVCLEARESPSCETVRVVWGQGFCRGYAFPGPDGWVLVDRGGSAMLVEVPPPPSGLDMVDRGLRSAADVLFAVADRWGTDGVRAVVWASWLARRALFPELN